VGQDFILEASWSHSERTTLGRTPLHERSAHRTHLYLTTHNTHERQTSMSPNPQPQQASGPQTYALVGEGTGIGAYKLMTCLKISFRHTHGNNDSNQLKPRRKQTPCSTAKRLFQPHVGPASALKSPKLVTHFTLSGGTPVLFLRVFKARTITNLSFFFILYNDEPKHS
jgi:hypothetical protein